MDYLSSNRYVHRDLAARNVMIDSDLCLKVADFGLTRDIYTKDYYRNNDNNAKFPVKWMAPESIEHLFFNNKTDVWSYGILMWELMTRGAMPYPGVENWQLLQHLKEGHRMDRPKYCPKDFYDLMLKCWAFDNKNRPLFKDMIQLIKTLIKIELEKNNTQNYNSNVNYTVINHCYENLVNSK